MADIGRGQDMAGDERLPWLEAVEDEDAERSPGAGRLLAAVVVALIAIGLIVGGLFWLRDRGRGTADDGPGTLIAAPAEPYKVKPDEPGGMRVDGQGETAYAASEGTETNAAINLNALPETPLAGAGAVTNADAAAAAPKVAVAAGKVATGPTPPPAKVAAADKLVVPATKPVVVASAKPMPPVPVVEAPVTGGTIQLGAFSTEAKANAAWKSLSGRFSFLAPLTKLVIPVKAGGSTLYRLRVAAGGQAGAICGKLKVAGETCARIGS